MLRMTSTIVLSLSLGIVYADGPTTKPAQEKPTIKLTSQELASFIIRHEGKKDTAYKNKRGRFVVGVGFDLNKADAKDRIEKMGLNYAKVRAGLKLSDSQIMVLLKDDMTLAIKKAEGLSPGFLEKQPKECQAILIDICFAMGDGEINSRPIVKAMIGSMNKGDYEQAQEQIKSSAWYQENVERGADYVVLLKQIKPTTTQASK